MFDEYSQSPKFRIVLIALIILFALSFLFRGKRRPPDVTKIFAGNLQESVGFVAGEEAAKLLGEKGGRVAVILPGAGDADERRFATLPAGAYERGVKKALAKSSLVKFDGHFTADPAMHRELMADWNMPTFRTFQSARQQFPNVDLFISIVGLPRFNPNEQSQWMAAAPPKVIAVQDGSLPPEEVANRLQADLAQVALVWRSGVRSPDQEPTGEPRDVVNRFYELVKR